MFSGYPTGDRSGWDEFREEYRRVHADLHADFSEFMQERGCPPLPELEFIHRSPYLNLFLYPEEADYERSRPLGPMWERLDSCVRKEGLGDFEVPRGDGPLVYLSLGSLGSADVELMQRLVDLLAAGGYRAIVSKGPQHDQIELRDGQAGAELVPQPALLPLVDAVITHGGNNTVTECLHFGKPMVLLPLFWDQYDNAQRMDELGLGVRLPTFEFEDAQLGEAIERLTGDEALAGRLGEIATRLQGNPGTERAADCIESVRSAEPRARDRACRPTDARRPITRAMHEDERRPSCAASCSSVRRSSSCWRTPARRCSSTRTAATTTPGRRRHGGRGADALVVHGRERTPSRQWPARRPVAVAAQGAGDHEADSAAVVVDRAGLVVDQAEALAEGDQCHLVEVLVVSPLAGDHPEVAGVAQAGAVADEGLLGLVLGLHEHDRAVQQAGFDQPAADRLLDVAAQAGAHVARDLHPLLGPHAQFLHRRAVAVVAFRRHGRPEFCHLQHSFR